jgi:hypothetical protein
VKEESPDELVSRNGHGSHLVSAGVIPPTERDVVTIERDKPVVGDGDAKVLSPRVKDAEETNLGAEMLRITRHLAECFGHSAEQQVVEFGLILQDECVEFVRQREYNVEVTS